MKTRKFLNMIFSLFILASLLFSGSGPALADPPQPPGSGGSGNGKITHAERQAAAARALQQGELNPLMMTAEATAVTAANLIGGAPHYFSHPNYANSPLPTVEAPSYLLVTGCKIALTPRISRSA